MFADNLQQDIDLINKFYSEYFNKTNTINTNITTVVQKLDSVIEEEKQNKVFLSNLQNKISESDLDNTYKTLLTLSDTLNKKYQEYNLLIEGNAKKINEISSVLKEHDNLIKNIYDEIHSLNNMMIIINNKLVK